MSKSAERLRIAVKAALEAKKFTKSDFAKRTKISRSNLERFLGGKSITLTVFDRMAKTLGPEPSEIIKDPYKSATGSNDLHARLFAALASLAALDDEQAIRSVLLPLEDLVRAFGKKPSQIRHKDGESG